MIVTHAPLWFLSYRRVHATECVDTNAMKWKMPKLRFRLNELETRLCNGFSFSDGPAFFLAYTHILQISLLSFNLYHMPYFRVCVFFSRFVIKMSTHHQPNSHLISYKNAIANESNEFDEQTVV